MHLTVPSGQARARLPARLGRKHHRQVWVQGEWAPRFTPPAPRRLLDVRPGFDGVVILEGVVLRGTISFAGAGFKSVGSFAPLERRWASAE